MKKTISLIIAVILAFNIFSIAGFAQENLNYLVLGDSIAYGSGIANPVEACYGKIVADTNGYNYKNLSKPGSTSENLLNSLDNEEVAQAVANADIIQISIGGNDFLRHNIALLILNGMFGNMAPFNEIQQNFLKNGTQIILKIKELNPDAHILVQTIYNPNFIYARTFQLGLDRINGTIRAGLEDYPGTYTIVDVGNHFKGHWDYIAVDVVHPNAKGNLEIAKLTLQVLKDLGLGENTEPVIETEAVDLKGFHALNVYNFIQAIFLRMIYG